MRARPSIKSARRRKYRKRCRNRWGGGAGKSIIQLEHGFRSHMRAQDKHEQCSGCHGRMVVCKNGHHNFRKGDSRVLRNNVRMHPDLLVLGQRSNIVLCVCLSGKPARCSKTPPFDMIILNLYFLFSTGRGLIFKGIDTFLSCAQLKMYKICLGFGNESTLCSTIGAGYPKKTEV